MQYMILIARIIWMIFWILIFFLGIVGKAPIFSYFGIAGVLIISYKIWFRRK